MIGKIHDRLFSMRNQVSYNNVSCFDTKSDLNNFTQDPEGARTKCGGHVWMILKSHNSLLGCRGFGPGHGTCCIETFSVGNNDSQKAVCEGSLWAEPRHKHFRLRCWSAEGDKAPMVSCHPLLIGADRGSCFVQLCAVLISHSFSKKWWMTRTPIFQTTWTKELRT